jgi:group I intron endonuclease
MSICKALIKYGHSLFSFIILEYCEADVRIERENFYINLFSPAYNVLKQAGLPPPGTRGYG